jgi:CheY-like chemotaxis protein
MEVGPSVLVSDKINLDKVCILVVDDNNQSVEIMMSVLSGFGARNLLSCNSADEAKTILKRNRVDLLLTDAEMPGENGYELVRWLRSECKEPNRYASAMVVTGHTRVSRVELARDCGAHFVVTKPITPDILLQRIFWVASGERIFVDCDSYKGPDRRFKHEGPPAGSDGRRADDLPADVGEATTPNMTQDELDSMLKVGKVAL